MHDGTGPSTIILSFGAVFVAIIRRPDQLFIILPSAAFRTRRHETVRRRTDIVFSIPTLHRRWQIDVDTTVTALFRSWTQNAITTTTFRLLRAHWVGADLRFVHSLTPTYAASSLARG